jgi:hypothetical protein
MSPKTADLTLLIAGGVLIALISTLTVLVAPPPDEGFARGSSFTSAPAGAKAAFLVLERLGYRVTRSFDPITVLTNDPSRSVLVIASPSEAPSDQDRRAVLAFLHRGGIVLATGSRGARFLPEFGGELAARDLLDLRVERYRAVIPSGLAVGVPMIELASEVVGPAPRPGWVAVYGEGDEAVVYTARFGGGRAVWWAGSTPLTNASLGAPGNLELLLNVVGPPGSREVLWDEHYHGYSRTFLSYVSGTPLPWVLAQLGLIGVAAVVTYSRRSGPVRARVVPPRTSAMEFVTTMGGLYERAGVSAAAVATARARVRRVLRGACGLPASVTDEDLARFAAPRLGVDVRSLADLLRVSHADNAGPQASPKQALEIIDRLQALAAAAERPASRRGARSKEH